MSGRAAPDIRVVVILLVGKFQAKPEDVLPPDLAEEVAESKRVFRKDTRAAASLRRTVPDAIAEAWEGIFGPHAGERRVRLGVGS